MGCEQQQTVCRATCLVDWPPVSNCVTWAVHVSCLTWPASHLLCLQQQSFAFAFSCMCLLALLFTWFNIEKHKCFCRSTQLQALTGSGPPASTSLAVYRILAEEGERIWVMATVTHSCLRAACVLYAWLCQHEPH